VWSSGATANLFKKGLSENLFKKGFIENGVVGVINRRNGFGSTVFNKVLIEKLESLHNYRIK
jgi:hypothetical protein